MRECSAKLFDWCLTSLRAQKEVVSTEKSMLAMQETMQRLQEQGRVESDRLACLQQEVEAERLALRASQAQVTGVWAKGSKPHISKYTDT